MSVQRAIQTTFIFVSAVLFTVAPGVRAATDFVPATASDHSVNWAGYVATGGTYTSVAGSWIVPKVSSAVVNGADTTWVGIGGSVTNDLLQAGTEAIPDPNSGAIAYQAWYEALPGDSVPVPLDVSPGDSVSVMITRESGNLWLISFSNNTTGRTYKKEVHYLSSLSSAEWIEEVPIVIGVPTVLDDFGSIPFTNGYTIKNGQPMTIAQSGARALTMNNTDHQALAVPSVLSPSGSGFSVDRTQANSSALALSQDGIVSASGSPTDVGGSGRDGFAFSIQFPIVPIISVQPDPNDGWQVVVMQF